MLQRALSGSGGGGVSTITMTFEITGSKSIPIDNDKTYIIFYTNNYAMDIRLYIINGELTVVSNVGGSGGGTYSYTNGVLTLTSNAGYYPELNMAVME